MIERSALLVYRRLDGWAQVVGLFGVVGKRYVHCACQDKTEGVGVFVAEKWAYQVIQVDRYNRENYSG